MDLITKTTSPDRCLLGITLPMTYEEFIEFSSSKERSDFIWANYEVKYNFNQDRKWQEYKKLLEIIKDIATEVCDAGGHVLYSFSGKDLKKIANYDVVTIIAHWAENKSSIELYDSSYSPEEFVKCIPIGFSGLLDLTICHSVQLIGIIKEHFPNSLLLTNSGTTQLEFRLLLYKAIINLLKVSPMSYMDAYTYLMKQLIKYYQ